jgi:hypothetical protein
MRYRNPHLLPRREDRRLFQDEIITFRSYPIMETSLNEIKLLLLLLLCVSVNKNLKICVVSGCKNSFSSNHKLDIKNGM